MKQKKFKIRIGAYITVFALFLFTLSPIASALEATHLHAASKIDPVLTETMSALSSGEKIPVYLFTSDINQEEIKAETEKALGFTQESITASASVFDEELTSALTSLTANNASTAQQIEVSELIQGYLDRTETERMRERQLTDAYIAKQRELAKAAYATAAEQTLDSLNLEEDDVLFVSRYAPMIIASMTPNEIQQASYNNRVQTLQLVKETEVAPVEPRSGETPLPDMRNYNGIDTIHQTTGLIGQGARIGIVESGSHQPHEELPSNRCHVVGVPYNFGDGHSTRIARIAAGTEGVAPGAYLFSCAIERGAYNYFVELYLNFFAAVELLLDNNVQAINCSWSITSTGYNSADAWIDHIVSVHNVSFVTSAGNDGETPSHHIGTPACGYNVITIGSFDNKNTSTKSDDELYSNSSYINSGTIGKPDLVASANALLGGTSSASAFVTGVVALMMELRPSLSMYPQAVKAILMASCLRKVISSPVESMNASRSSLTERQGAGAMDAYLAIAITGAGHYGMRTLSGGQVSEDVHVYQPPYDANGMSIAMTWLRENTVSGTDHESGTVTQGTAYDMDLKVLRGSTTLISCLTTNTSTEFAHITDLSGGNSYTFQLKKFTSTSGSVRCAYAWGLDTDRFQYSATNEGIYYLKNAESGQFLQMNASTLNVVQNTYQETADLRWIIKKNADGTYRIISANGTYGDLTHGSAILTVNYGASITSSGTTSNVSLYDNGDGSYSIMKTVNGTLRALEANSLATSARIVWTSLSASNGSQSWYLEPYAMMRGDVDGDGDVTMTDYRLVTYYASDKETPNNQQEFLADVDGDGEVTTTDARLIMTLASGEIF